MEKNTLCGACNRLAKGFTVPVRLNPEPHNVKDSKAIAFQCELDRKWTQIGYVMKELLDVHVHVVHVHAAFYGSNTLGLALQLFADVIFPKL